MQCPCCKKENPAHPQPCALCGYDPTIPYEPATSRAGKAAVASFVLAILSFFAFLITAIPAIILACIALWEIRRTPDRLRGKRLAIASIIVSVFTSLVIPPAFYSLWRLDAPPIPNDYTIADLRSAPADCAESFELLMSVSPSNVNRDKVPGIRLSVADLEDIRKLGQILREGNESKTVETVRENEEVIERAWRETEKGRRIVEELAQFVEIADLGEPDGSFAPFNMVHLADLNQAYIHFQIARGQAQIPIKELIELDSVARSLSVNARPLITKLLCFACISSDIMTANAIANNPGTEDETVELLVEHFSPLTEEIISLKNAVLHEYLRFKNIIAEELDKATVLSSLTLKRNSILRVYRNWCDNLLMSLDGRASKQTPAFSVWPSAYRGFPDVSFRPREGLPFIYKCYNPKGSAIVSTFDFRFDKAVSTSTEIQIQNDLLRIVLSKRLGRPVSLKARAYGDEYIVDVKGKRILSPGADGVIDTEDDIKLPINPEVLGWEE